MKALYEDMQVQKAVNSVSVAVAGEALAAAATPEVLVCHHEFMLRGSFIDVS